jgi:hypothetical protein
LETIPLGHVGQATSDETFARAANSHGARVSGIVPVTSAYHGQRFFVREDAAHSPYPPSSRSRRSRSSCTAPNVFAILGLRALYFLLADVIHRFHYLKVGLSVLLVFVEVKMLAVDLYEVPIGASLGFIVLVLGMAIAASWFWPPTPERCEAREPESETSA